MYIYYDSKTGNVQRFIEKIKKERPDWNYVKIVDTTIIENKGHLITYTTNFGEVSENTFKFMENESNRKYIKSVSSSGNMNWGTMYAVAADKISERYKIPVLMKFELSGTYAEAKYFINNVEDK